MSHDILKLLIEAACSSGNISEQQYLHLIAKAQEYGISDNDLAYLIASELTKVQKQKQLSEEPASGFISDDGSGFITASSTEPAEIAKIYQHKAAAYTAAINNLRNNTENIQASFSDIKDLNLQGAMSIVQKGKFNGKWVVIKRIKEEFRTDSRYKELFFKEFENSYLLDHPNIVRVLGKGMDFNGAYYYMDYIDGQPITKIIGSDGIKDLNLVKKIALEILSGLDYVHKKQIYHRDLKPDNILITYKGNNVKLIDFGLAAADYFDDRMIKAGTYPYCAPEQKTKASQIDGRADVYSFGIVLLEMLSGSKLDLNFVSNQHGQTLSDIIKKCTTIEISKRYQDCSEIIEILKQSKPKLQITPTTVDFGKIDITETKTQTVFVRNSGSIGQVDWQIIECPKWLKTWKYNDKLEISFNPQIKGNFSGQIRIDAKDAGKETINVKATVISHEHKTKRRAFIVTALIMISIVISSIFWLNNKRKTSSDYIINQFLSEQEWTLKGKVFSKNKTIIISEIIDNGNNLITFVYSIEGLNNHMNKHGKLQFLNHQCEVDFASIGEGTMMIENDMFIIKSDSNYWKFETEID